MLEQYAIFFSEQPAFFYLFSLVIGACIGSFLNVVIYRLPIMLQEGWREECHDFLKLPYTPLTKKTNLFYPGSQCPGCKKKIKFWQNIPLLSYCLLKGRCAGCHASISIRYPIVESLSALLTLLVAMQFGPTLSYVFASFFIWFLIALAFIDLDTQLLPDSLTLGLLWFGLLVNSHSLFTTLPNAVFAAATAYSSLWLLIKGYYLVSGKIGMGEGDFKLFAALGAWLGLAMLPLILLLSSLIGAIIGISYLTLSKQDKSTPIPFGPYLCIAGLIALLWGRQLLDWYLGFYS